MEKKGIYSWIKQMDTIQVVIELFVSIIHQIVKVLFANTNISILIDGQF